MQKLAIITTHPIQYYAPVFQLLAKKINIKVFYTAGHISLEKYDIGFKQKVEWDIDLLSEYEYEFLENVAKDKGSHHFQGIVNPDVIKKINNYHPDAILIYGWAYISHLKIIRHFKGKTPIYFRGDSTLLDQKASFKNVIRSIFLRWVYKHVDIAFYVGTANKAYFKKYGLKENQLIFAPHAIDNNRFTANRGIESDLIRKKFSIKKDDILILFAGKLEPKKNPKLLIEAFIDIERSSSLFNHSASNEEIPTIKDQLQTSNKPQIHLLFVGNGILEETLKVTVENLKLKCVHFLGFQNQTQMPVIYQACDLFCLPSQGPGETWGLAVNEAMAAGKAILVSDKVGCAKDLVNFNNGAVFQSGNLIDLSQKLIALTNDKAKLKIMGENSLKFIQKWNFEQQVNAIVSHANR